MKPTLRSSILAPLGRPRWLAAALACTLVLCGLFGEPGRSASGGDAIGSLPCAGPGPESGIQQYVPPSFSLEGTLPELLALVVSAEGNGHVELQHLPNGFVRARFYGDVTLALNRDLLPTAQIRYGLDLGNEFGGGLAVSTLNHRRISITTLPPSFLAVPLPLLEQCGVLDQGLLKVHSVSPTSKHYWLQLSADAQTVRITTKN